MTPSLILRLGITAGLLCAPCAGATILYSNLGSGNSYNTSSTWTFPATFSFTAATTGTLNDILVPLSRTSGSAGVILSLYDNNSTQPGTLLFTTTLNPGLTTTMTLFDIAVNGPTLTQGNTYWFGISSADTATTTIGWANNNTNDNGTRAVFVNNAWNTNQTGVSKGAFQLTTNPVPEPSTILLTMVGLVVLFIRRRRSWC